MKIFKIKKTGQFLGAIALANLFAIGMIGCSSGKSGNNDVDFTVYTVSKSVKVIDGDLTECRVVDSNGHVAVEISPSNYEFTFEESETLGDLSATDCKEVSSGLRFNITMNSNSQKLITPLTTLQKNMPAAFTKLASVENMTEDQLLGEPNLSNFELLQISNVVSAMYSMDSINEFSSAIYTSVNMYEAAKTAIGYRYQAEIDSGMSVDYFKAFIDKIENTSYDEYFTTLYGAKKLVKLVYKAPAIVSPPGKVGLIIVDTKNQAISDVDIFVDANIVDAEGDNEADRNFISTENGLFSFYVDEAENGDNLIKVMVKKDGYLDSSVQMNPTDFNQTLTKIIKLVKISVEDLPSGVGLEQEEITDSVDIDTGIVNQSIALSVENKSSESESTLEVTIPANTQLLDEDGEPVTGALTSTIVSFAADDNDSTAFEAFPGGFDVRVSDAPETDNNDTNNDTNEDNTTNVSFQSAGFVSIQIEDESGTKVKNFGSDDDNSTGIEVAMQVPTGTVNPDTGLDLKIGDSIPIWNFNEDTGDWAYQGDGNVTDLDTTDGMFDVVFTTKHLTYFNLDWFASPTCTAHVNINDAFGAKYKTSLNINTPYKNKTAYDYNADGYYDILRFPTGVDVNLTLSLADEVLTSKVINLSAGNCTADINVSIEPPKMKQLKYVEQCSDGSNSNSIEGVIIYKIVNNSWSYEGSSDGYGDLEILATNSNDTRLYSYFYSDRYKSTWFYSDLESGEESQTIEFTLADQYCATASNQVISMAGEEIVFKENGESEQNSTILRKADPNNVESNEIVSTTLEKIMYAMSRIEFNAIEENLNIDVARAVNNGVVGMNIRELDSNEINMNMLFTGVNYGASYKLMDIGDPYVLFVETEDEGDVFINGKIDKLNEEATLTRSNDTKTWTFIPYNLLYEDILNNDRFTEVEEELNEKINDEADMEITFFFNDNLPLKDFYAKDKATNILHTNYDDVIEPLCGEGETDCSVKYFKTIVNIKNAQ